jgi:uncharacterized membrane protein
VDVTSLLRSLPLFEGLSDEDLGAIAGRLQKRSYRAGEVVFHQGDLGDSMYFVNKGNVNIHLPGEDSRRISLKDLGPGEFFGEVALLDGEPRTASALCSTNTTLLELQREALEEYLKNRPQAAMSILRSMGQRMRRTISLLDSRAAKNVDEEFERSRSWSEQLSDQVAELNGSWKFILLLILLTLIWCAGNSTFGLVSPLDPYPYQFFNLALAILVALQGPLIVMSQNRQAKKDRARAETDYQVNLKNEVNIETLLRELSEFRNETADRLDQLDGKGQPSATAGL